MTNPFLLSSIEDQQAQPPANANPFALQAIQSDQRQDLRNTLTGAVRENPDQAARAAQLTKRYPVPADVLARNLMDVEMQAAVDKADETLRTSPKLARAVRERSWLAPQAHDDFPPLAALETTLNQRADRTALGTLGDVGVVALKGAIGLPQAFVGLADILTGGYAGKGVEATGVRFAEAQKLLDTLYSPAQQQANEAVREADGFINTLGAMLSNPSTIATTVGESAPQMVGGAALGRGLLAAAPKLAPWLAAAFGEGLMGAGSSAEQIRSETDDGLLSAKQVFASTMSGAGTALFGAVGGRAAQRLGLADVDTALVARGVDDATAKTLQRGFITRIAGAGISEGVFEELPQSVQEQLWQNWATDRPLGEGVGKAAAQGLLAGLSMGGGFQAASEAGAALQRKLVERESAIDRAQTEGQRLTEALQTASQSKLRERNPETFEQLVNAMSEGADGTPQSVYIDAQVLLQSATAEELAQILPSTVEQLQEAATSNGTIEVPVAEALTYLPGTPLEQVFLQNARSAPNAMSLADADQASKQAEQYLQQEADRVLQQAADTQAWQQSSETVKTTILDQLNSTGRFTSDVNEAYATLQSNFFSTMAARTGMTPTELYDRYSLKVAAKQAGQGGVLNADEGPAVTITEDRDETTLYSITATVPSAGNAFINAEANADGSFQIRESGVPEEARGQGLGVRLYEGLLRDLFARGAVQVTSDTSVSADAQRVYQALRNRGYVVEQSPDAVVDPETGALESDQPVFTVRPRTDPGMLEQSVTTQVSPLKGAVTDPSIVKVPGIAEATAPGGEEQLAHNTELFGKNEQTVAGKPKRGYDSIILPTDGTAIEKAEAVISQMVRNLQSIFDAIPEAIRQRSKLWYDGANRISLAFAERYDLTPMQTAAQLAVTSPQADWRMNVSYVERINDILQERQDHTWDPQMDKWAKDWINSKAQVEGRAKETKRKADAVKAATKDEKKAAAFATKKQAIVDKLTADGADAKKIKDAAKEVSKAQTLLRKAQKVTAEKQASAAIPDANMDIQQYIVGKKLSELTTDEQRAWWVRTYDEAHHDRGFRDVSPEGGFLDMAKTDSGKNDSVAWKSFNAIQKAISIHRDGSLENVHAQLGGEHKVRNFYNNIYAPNSPSPFVTSDTHQVAANLFLPLGADALEVGQNFGGTGTKSVSDRGLNGTYWYYSEAVKRAAESRGVLPREMQSISWEAIRSLFSATFKSDAGKVNAVRDMWVTYQEGNATYEDTIQSIVDFAGGYTPPTWVGVRPDSARAPEQGHSSYASELAHSRQGLRGRDGSGPRDTGDAGQAVSPGVLNQPGGTAGDDRAGVLRHTVEVAKSEILQDIADGTLPESVSSFVDLHDYVDANMYVNDADRADRRIGPLGERLGWTMDDFIDFTNEAMDEVNAWLQAGRPSDVLEQGPRGTFSPSQLLLTLNENADLSTFLHESGHFFLEVMADLSSQPNAPQQIQDDMAATLKWFGVPDLATWNSYTLDQKRPYHERWAESFEQYLFEGKAPSPELQPLFRRFRSWMVNVYKSLTEFMRARDLKVNDEVRQVFGRLIATDEQIAQAEEAAGLLPDFDATNEAIEALQARSLRDLKWTVRARGKVLKALEKEAKTLRKEVEAEVRAEVEQQPLYKAMNWLKKGETTDPVTGDVVKAEKGYRLLTTALAEMYPETMLARPDLTGLRGMTGKEGLHPDMVADMFGFESGDKLVRAILDAEPIASVIEGMTDQRMLERHGDLATPEALEAAANEAVHNEARARSLATELKSQAEMLNPRQDTGRTASNGRAITVNAITAAAKQFAANLAARRRIKDLKNAAWQHRSAEARAGKAWQAATAKADTQAAVQAKRDQVLNNAAVKALQDAQVEVKQILEFFKRVTKGNDEKVVERGRDPDVVNAMRAILGAYDVAPRLEKTALAYMETVAKNDPAMYAALQPSVQGALLNAKPLTEMTMEELRGLNDELRAMWALAKSSRQSEIDGNLVDREELEDALVARMGEIGIPDTIPGEKGAITDRQELGIKLQFAKSILSRVEQWAERLDGKFGGPFLRYVFQPVKEAADRYRTDKVSYRKKFTELLKNVAPALPAGPIEAPELGYTFGNARDSGAAELLHAILHTGNDSNKRKLLLGRGWATQDAEGNLDTTQWDAFIQRMQGEGKLNQKHYDFAQGVWDLLEDMKPLAQKTHRKVFGRYFAEITANEFTTPFGTYRGGYVPAQTDSRLVKDAKLRELAEGENESMAYAFPAAPSGFTKSRVEYNQPLLLDLRALGQHMDKVLLFSHMQGAVTDVRRLLTSKRVSYALDRIDPGAYEGMLIPWLNRSARQVVETPVVGDRKISRFLSAARSRAGMALMFANLSNTVQQVTGFTMAGVKVKPGLIMSATARFMADPKAMKTAVAGASPYMQDRMLNEVGAMNDAIEEILVDPTLLERGQAWTQRHAYFMQAAVDNTMSPIIWTAAYNQAIEQKMDERNAVRFADGVIRQTQGTTLPEDISRFESGPGYARLFTQFVSYFNMMANTNATAVKQIADEVGLKKGAGKVLYVALAGLLAPIWVAEAIAQVFRGGPEDEDKDGWLDDWLLAVFGMGTLKGLTAQIPIVGQAGQLVINRFNDNPADDKFSLSPAVSLIESTVSAPSSVYKAIVEDGNKQRAVRDVAAAATMITGLPIYGVARPIGYLAGIAGGNIEPTGPVDLARGIVTGTASPESKQR